MQHYTNIIHHLFSGFILEYRLCVIDAMLSASMAVLHDIYRNMRMRRCFLDAAMCGLFAWVARDMIVLMGWGIEWTNIMSVLIGFMGVDYIGKTLIVIINKIVHIK
ncbi:phage holin, lambda family [Rahnella aquatilis]|uniref:phage holin, lambda family n=1 Tax=Rahnella aquatilis TaxID=34038 RepID=UPI00069041CE